VAVVALRRALSIRASSASSLITVEDHWAEGGIGDAVLDVFAERDERPRVIKLAVRELPRSGSPAELLNAARIDVDAIVEAARSLVDQEASDEALARERYRAPIRSAQG